MKEIVRELKIQREVDFHDNIIRCYGVTKLESENHNNYRLVMEYADGVHRDLHSCNILDEEYDVGLAVEISQGLRETVVPDTPEEYVKIYTKCWDGEPDNRGIGVEKDYNKAFELFKQAAGRENINGIMMLGYCYDEGIGTEINKQKAFELYQNAANLGNKVAQNNFALMYRDGDGIARDVNKAIYWLEKSAKQGYELAKDNLKRLQKNQ
ncbi:kinase-like domain-containing protein [Rhizophagus irregularis DAOM 181602=DAOM 197198]|nr:kinase-like domain-containing protein [Rhizophagus irregularis DAOM 181602=DAOM 197198]